jgi:hypothetical protein
MGQKFTNNARSRLVGALSGSATSFTVEASTADLFPIANTPNWLASVDWFKATIENSLGQVEIVKVGVRSLGSGVFSNVLRAQDGTSAIAFDAGSVVGLRFTSADLQSIFDSFETMVQITGDQSINGVKTFLQKVVGDLQGKADTAGHADTADASEAAETAETVTGTVADGAVATTQAAKDATHKVATNAFVDRMRSMHASTNAATLVISDRGSVVRRAAATTVPAGVFAQDDVVTIKNTSGTPFNVIAGAGMTLIRAGTTTIGSFSLGANGLVTILFDSAGQATYSGAGVS